MQRLVCFHGHYFEVPSDYPAAEIVCPLCGTYRHYRGDLETDDSKGGNRTEDRRVLRVQTPMMTRGSEDRTEVGISPPQWASDTVDLGLGTEARSETGFSTEPMQHPEGVSGGRQWGEPSGEAKLSCPPGSEHKASADFAEPGGRAADAFETVPQPGLPSEARSGPTGGEEDSSSNRETQPHASSEATDSTNATDDRTWDQPLRVSVPPTRDNFNHPTLDEIRAASITEEEVAGWIPPARPDSAVAKDGQQLALETSMERPGRSRPLTESRQRDKTAELREPPSLGSAAQSSGRLTLVERADTVMLPPGESVTDQPSPLGETQELAPIQPSAASELAATGDLPVVPRGVSWFPECRSKSLVRGDSIGDQPAETERGRSEKPQFPGYEIFEELGRGGMGAVYRARDIKNNRMVALKTLLRMGPRELHRFKGEFRSLADIFHPNVALLYELHSDGQTWCFSMELLEGVEFLEFVWSGFAGLRHEQRRSLQEVGPALPRLTERRIKRLYESLKQLVLGLNKLHEHGFLHRDVKPSNVMVTASKRLVVLDFGLASALRDEELDGKSRGIQGTPEYMSPEQAACKELTPASDWYAVGVMLYEVLTGRLPFEGTIGRVLSMKQRQRPAEPRALMAGVPVELNTLCMGLLDRQPSQRPTAADILRCIDAADLAESLRYSGRKSTRPLLLVGRERHLALLRRSYEEVRQGATQSVFVHGFSGMGKSELVRQFLQELRLEREAIVLQGRCYEQESVPFKALDSLIDALSDYLCKLAPDAAARYLPQDMLALVRLFPVLGQVPGLAKLPAVAIGDATQRELRQRAWQALRDLLTNLGREHPLVLYIDDLQWGDEDSARLLADLVRPPLAPRLLLIATYRRENADDSVCLRVLREEYRRGRSQPQFYDLLVDALDDDEATRLARMLLGRQDAGQRGEAQKIARESRGCPFFVWELARHVQEDDTEVAERVLDLDEVIWQRAQRLGEPVMRMLELIAVAGRPLPVELTFQVQRVAVQGPALITELRNESFVRTTQRDGVESVVEAYHDRIRESVVKHLSPEVIRHHHSRLAETIEQQSQLHAEELLRHLRTTPDFSEPDRPYELDKQQRQRVFELAFHYDAAGKHAKAFPYALVAAEQARMQNALEVAEQQYQIALRGVATFAPAFRFRVLEGLGEVLNLQGHYPLAKRQFELARDLAEGLVARGRIEGKLGEVAFKQGDMKLSMDHLERALKELGKPIPPKQKWLVLPQLLWEVAVQGAHTLFPSWFLGRAALQDDRTQLLPIRIYNRLFYPYWFARDEYATFWAQLRGMNLAERYPPTPELAHAYSCHAAAMSAIPAFARGLNYAQRGEEVGRAVGNIFSQGQAAHFHGVLLFSASRWHDAITKCREAIGYLERAGDQWEANMARYHIAESLYHLGHLREAVAEAKRVHDTGMELGDVQAIGVITVVWAAAAPHAVPVAEIVTELARHRDDPLSSVQVLQAKGFKTLLHDHKPEMAAEDFSAALRLAKQRGLKNTYVGSAYSWYATCLRQAMEEAEKGSSHRRRLERMAGQAAHQAVRVALKFKNSLPHAYREAAYLAAEQGNERLARLRLQQSLEWATRQQAAYQLAKSRLAQARIGLQFRGPAAEAQLLEAQAEIDRLEAERDPDASSLQDATGHLRP